MLYLQKRKKKRKKWGKEGNSETQASWGHFFMKWGYFKFPLSLNCHNSESCRKLVAIHISLTHKNIIYVLDNKTDFSSVVIVHSNLQLFSFLFFVFFGLFLNPLQPKLLVFIEKLSWVIGPLYLQLLLTKHTDSHTHAWLQNWHCIPVLQQPLRTILIEEMWLFE